MPKTVDITITKKINCSKDVAFWNYWDHEHLDVVHEGYKKSDILYDKKNFLFRIDKIKMPIFGFLSMKTPIFMVQHDEDTLFTYAIQLGIVSKTTISIKEDKKKSSILTMNYKFYLEGWSILLAPLLKILIPRWNEKVWKEDFPVKIRRQKVLSMNFKDFIGLPKDLNDRILNDFKERKLKLPIPRPRNSSRDRHPLKVK